MNYAGFWRRFGAAIVDSIVMSAGVGVLLGIVYAAGLPIFLNTDYAAETRNLAVSAEFSADFAPLGVIILVVLPWLYMVSFESSKLQGTPGKLALALRVTDIEGNRVSFLRSVGRNLAKIISTVILFIGFMMAGWTKRKQALHDIIAGCLVVSGRP